MVRGGLGELLCGEQVLPGRDYAARPEPGRHGATGSDTHAVCTDQRVDSKPPPGFLGRPTLLTSAFFPLIICHRTLLGE